MNIYSDLLPIDAEFQLRARQAIIAAQQNVRQLAVLVISVNQRDGSPAPAEAIAKRRNLVLLRLKNRVREWDTVSELADGRIGVLLHAIASRDDIDKIVKRLLAGLEEFAHADDTGVRVATHAGVALFPEHGEQVVDLLDRAEDALAQAIASECLYAVYSASGEGRINERQWMAELRQAIVSDQLFLLYQPKVNLADGTIAGVEVLTRWQHPKTGTITPDKFIPLAERTGLIIPMTLWVLQRALQQCRIWHDRGLNLSVAVNLAMWNLETLELPLQIESLLRDTGVAPNSLELEITESAIMSDPERVLHTLTQIRRLGVGFAIDDFGTGYSSFAYLKKLPVASIKIDKSFVFNIENERDNSVIVGSIAELGHRLGMKVVAEGVETQACQELLTTLNCDEAQGYHFSRPALPAALGQILAERANPQGASHADAVTDAAGAFAPSETNDSTRSRPRMRHSHAGQNSTLDLKAVAAHNAAQELNFAKTGKE